MGYREARDAYAYIPMDKTLLKRIDTFVEKPIYPFIEEAIGADVLRAPEISELQQKIVAQEAVEDYEKPLWLRVAEEDPEMGLACFRVLFERELREVADTRKLTIPKDATASTLIQLLQQNGIITDPQRNIYNSVLPILNQAAHGLKVDPRNVEFILYSVGIGFLESIQNLR